MIADTSYCYTSEDGDGSGNSVEGIDDLVEGYAATVQSQATMIRDICKAANDTGVIGVFYAGGEEMTESFMVTGWADWKNPTISNIKISDSNLRFGVRMKCNAKSWGTVDDFTLNKISD